MRRLYQRQIQLRLNLTSCAIPGVIGQVPCPFLPEIGIPKSLMVCVKTLSLARCYVMANI